MIGLEFETGKDAMETPRTDKAAFVAGLTGLDINVVDAYFARQLEQENRNLRNLLDKASRALSCFVDLRGMTAAELKSAHNGICILLEATRMLDEIKAGVEEGE
jgi:hypothetical protein